MCSKIITSFGLIFFAGLFSLTHALDVKAQTYNANQTASPLNERVSLEASVDKTRLQPGDTVTYTLESVTNQNAATSPQAPSFEGFAIRGSLNSSNLTFMNGAVKVVLQQKFILLPLKKGDMVIGPASLSYVNSATGKQETIHSQSIKISVGEAKAVPGNRTIESTATPTVEEIRDIKGQLPEFFKISWWLVGAVLVVLGTVILYFIWRKWANKSAQTVLAEPLLDPNQEALKALKDALKLKENRDVILYYLALSAAVRRYLDRKYKLGSQESTTAELLRSLVKLKIKKSTADVTKAFFDQCDLVKFATYRPTAKQMEDAYEQAVSLIQ